MPKILVLDNLSKEGIQIFTQAGFEVDEMPPQKPEELAKIIGEYDGLVVRSATKVTKEALQNAKKLKVIGRAGAGTDNIDKDTATQMGIVVMNTPGGNTISACEHTFALLLALCRNIPLAHQSMLEGKWERKKFTGVELKGKTLGIIGVGRIGGAVAKRALAFEMKVLAHDPILTPLKAEALGVELVSFDELIERSDFITIHTPKTEKTINMIRMEHLKRMKPTCRIVNTARGGIINEEDLATALREKIIAGAALDVYSTEPPEKNPFIGLDNVILTPHLAASTEDAQIVVAVEIAKQMVDYLTTGAIVNAVNVPSIDPETKKQIQPLIYLGERLGLFQSLYTRGRPKSIHIEYTGDIGVTDTYPITASILTGFLKPLVETVNMISAPAQIKERGIECHDTKSAKPTNYIFEISVKVETDEESHTVCGTLFHRTDARICSIDGMIVDARPEGHILVCRNEDKPLVVGRLGMLLGEAGINIANLMLARDKVGGRALTVLNLDQPLTEDLVRSCEKIPHILEARFLTLPPGQDSF